MWRLKQSIQTLFIFKYEAPGHDEEYERYGYDKLKRKRDEKRERSTNNGI